MKQTVEEAARENILFNHRTVDSFVEGFKKGAKAAEKEINKKFKSEI